MKLQFVKMIPNGIIAMFLCVLFATTIPAFSQKLTPGEQDVLKELQLDTTSFDTLIVLGVSSHNDWDWIGTFEEVYGGRYTDAFGCYPCCNTAEIKIVYDKLFQWENSKKFKNAEFPFDVAEIAFLRRYAKDRPNLFKTLSFDNVYIVGGGMTSASSLLSHGETFIRNQLLGTAWVKKHIPTYVPNSAGKARKTINYSWLPDDFALDPNLPAILEAMDLRGVGFSRVAGYPDTVNSGFEYGAHYHGHKYEDAHGSPGEELLEHHDVDFYWSAPDGSQTFAHWLVGKYSQLVYNYSNNEVQDQARNTPFSSNHAVIAQYIYDSYKLNSQYDHSKYVFLPLHGDGAPPPPLSLLKSWFMEFDKINKNKKVKLVIASFDQYARLVQAEMGDHGTAQPFVSAPVTEGMYASCPSLKIRHLYATQALLGAEVFSSILSEAYQNDQVPTAHIAKGWDTLVPSTHHAYVVGLGSACTYINEQRPVLATACELGDKARDSALTSLTNIIKVSSPDRKALVFNQLGFDRTGVAELKDRTIANAPHAAGAAIQKLDDETVLFMANAPSMGYQSIDMSNLPQIGEKKKVGVRGTAKSNSITFWNEHMTATLTKYSNGWSISSIKDKDGVELINGRANQLFHYDELSPKTTIASGGSFNFKYEGASTPENHSLPKIPFDFKNISITIAETGPLRVKIITKCSYTYDYEHDFTRPQEKNQYGQDTSTVWISGGTRSETIHFTQEYQLVAGEPYLQMKTTGRAPWWQSVYVSFPMVPKTSQDTFISYGTPYHWTREAIRPGWKIDRGWEGPFLKPTFGFATVEDAAHEPVASIYHKGVPAWGVVNRADTTILYGALFRAVGLYGSPDARWFNNNEGYEYHHPVDTFTTTVEYAFRIPNGQKDPTTGHPMMESMAYQVPLQARVLGKKNLDPKAPTQVSFSLARIEGKGQDSTAIISVAKAGMYDPGNLVLRVYQPSNTSMEVNVDLFSGNHLRTPTASELDVSRISALEEPFGLNVKRPGISAKLSKAKAGNPKLTFNAHRSITTMSIGKKK